MQLEAVNADETETGYGCVELIDSHWLAIDDDLVRLLLQTPLNFQSVGFKLWMRDYIDERTSGIIECYPSEVFKSVVVFLPEAKLHKRFVLLNVYIFEIFELCVKNYRESYEKGRHFQ